MDRGSLKAVVSFGVGFVSGWAARSIADSPQGVGVKLLEVAMNAKERVSKWAALEGERLEDMLAEARANAKPDASAPNPKTMNGHAQKPRAANEEA